MNMTLGRFSIGIGDRFGLEGHAQLRALVSARKQGIDVIPVWNKSNREHAIIGTQPGDVRHEADAAVKTAGWEQAYFVDADHIGMKTVDKFLGASDFFTIDVADCIGQPAGAESIRTFKAAMEPLRGRVQLPHTAAPMTIDDALIVSVANSYAAAVEEAARVYRYIAAAKGEGGFVPEVSFDEAATSQSPEELFLILGALAMAGIRPQTIAPKFVGEFLKGVDYVGDITAFSRQFDACLAVLDAAKERFQLPSSLKLSVHSGSDKFSLYPVINRSLNTTGAGLHLKTAGTTWLEEVIGLARGNDEGLAVAKEIYCRSYARREELSAPYLTVISIDPAKLPAPQTVKRWSREEFVGALRHDQHNPAYNLHLRQLIHIGYKVAAEMGNGFTEQLQHNRQSVESSVTENLFHRHLLPLFGAAAQ